MRWMCSIRLRARINCQILSNKIILKSHLVSLVLSARQTGGKVDPQGTPRNGDICRSDGLRQMAI